MPGAFSFLNLFLHIALPVAMFLGLWIHVSRVARPVPRPPRGLAWGPPTRSPAPRARGASRWSRSTRSGGELVMRTPGS